MSHEFETVDMHDRPTVLQQIRSLATSTDDDGARRVLEAAHDLLSGDKRTIERAQRMRRERVNKLTNCALGQISDREAMERVGVALLDRIERIEQRRLAEKEPTEAMIDAGLLVVGGSAGGDVERELMREILIAAMGAAQ